MSAWLPVDHIIVSSGAVVAPASDPIAVDAGLVWALSICVVLIVVAIAAIWWLRLQVLQLRRRQASMQGQISASQEQAAAADGGRSVFLASLSHEIRTPINAMLGYAQLLRRDPGLRIEQRRYCEAIYRNGVRLVGLVDDVLDMAALGSGGFTARSVSFDPRSVIGDLAELYAEDAANRGITFTCTCDDDVPSCLVGDVDRLRQVCTGLCNSAIGRSESGTIAVACSMSEDSSGARLLITISDSGRPVVDAGRSMGWHELLAALAEGNEEIDLGLAIARETTRHLDGRLEIRPLASGGTEVALDLPMGIGQATDTTRQHRRTTLILDRLQAPPHVLVVDDNAANRDMLDRLLSDVGFLVREAAGGQDALSLFGAWRPEVVLMDLLMPDMSGKEVVAAMRAQADGNHAKIIVVTAHDLTDEKAELIDVGADAVLRKPIDELELLNCIGRLAKVQYKAVDVRHLSDSHERSAVRLAALAAEGGEQPASDDPAAALPSEAVHLKETVLVVDDEDVNREIMGLLFAELGVEVCLAGSGEEALTLFVERQPRLVLTDLRMPGMDGFAFARQIRSSPYGDEAVVLALSGAVSQDLAEDPCEAGFDGVLSKPVRLPDLKDVLDRYGMVATK